MPPIRNQGPTADRHALRPADGRLFSLARSATLDQPASRPSGAPHVAHSYHSGDSSIPDPTSQKAARAEGHRGEGGGAPGQRVLHPLPQRPPREIAVQRRATPPDSSAQLMPEQSAERNGFPLPERRPSPPRDRKGSGSTLNADACFLWLDDLPAYVTREHVVAEANAAGCPVTYARVVYRDKLSVAQLAYESLEQQRHAFHALNGRLGLGMRLRPAIRHPRWLPDERAGAELAWTAEPVRRDSRPVTDHTTSKERTRSPVKQSRGAELKSSTSGAQRRRASRQQAEERFAAKRKRLQQALADLDREERRSKRSSRSKRESISPPSKKSRSSGKSKREPPSSPKRTSKRNEGSKREHLSSHRPASRRSSRSDREPENAGKSARARLSGRVTPPMDRVKRHMPPEQAVAQEDSLTMARISQSQKRPLVGVTPERALPPSEVAPWLDRTTWAMSTRAVGTGSNTFALAAHRNGHWSFPSPSDAAHAESQSSEVYAMGGGQPLGDASVNVSPSRRMPVFSPAPPEPGVPSVVPTGLVSAAEDDDAPSSNFPNGTAESDSCPSLRHPTLDSDARAAFDFPAGPDSQTEGHASQVLCTSANSSRALRKDFAIAGQSRTGKALYVRFA